MLKKLGITLIIGINTAFASMACDLCSTYLGINPGDFKNSFSMIQRIRNFEKSSIVESKNYFTNARLNHLSTSLSNSSLNKEEYREEFYSYDIRGRVVIKSRWLVDISMTFSDNYSYLNDSLINDVAGVGDIQAMVHYRLFNTKSALDSVKWIQRLTVGGGLKLPAGNYNKVGMEESLDPHLQPGTGSLDYIVFTEYQVKWKSVGLNSNVIYKFNTTNKNGFRFANRFNANAVAFYAKAIKKVNCMPSLGLSYESAERDLMNDNSFLGSGGQALFLTSGLRLFIQQFSFGATYFFKPMHEDLYDKSIQVNNKDRIISELTYFF